MNKNTMINLVWVYVTHKLELQAAHVITIYLHDNGKTSGYRPA